MRAIGFWRKSTLLTVCGQLLKPFYAVIDKSTRKLCGKSRSSKQRSVSVAHWLVRWRALHFVGSSPAYCYKESSGVLSLIKNRSPVSSDRELVVVSKRGIMLTVQGNESEPLSAVVYYYISRCGAKFVIKETAERSSRPSICGARGRNELDSAAGYESRKQRE